MAMKCPSCGSENDVQAKFCAICGRVLGTAASAPAMTGVTKICPYCGRIMNANAMICPSCGQSSALPPSYQVPYGGGSVVTTGRKYIAIGLIAAGLYFLWWGIYSAYYGAQYDWTGWGAADYMDMIFSFMAGLFVLFAGIWSLRTR
jgi:hypothetical protein